MSELPTRTSLSNVFDTLGITPSGEDRSSSNVGYL